MVDFAVVSALKTRSTISRTIGSLPWLRPKDMAYGWKVYTYIKEMYRPPNIAARPESLARDAPDVVR
jgi:hypothetical protein